MNTDQITTHLTNHKLIAEAKGWLEDCGADTTGRTHYEILREVEIQHVGGINEFISHDHSLKAS